MSYSMVSKVKGRRKTDVQLNFRLPASIKDEIDMRSKQIGCSSAAFIRWCIIEKLGYIKGVENAGFLNTSKKKIRFENYLKMMAAQIDLQELHYTKNRDGIGIDQIESYPVFTRDEVEGIIGEVMEEKINKILAERGLTPVDTETVDIEKPKTECTDLPLTTVGDLSKKNTSTDGQ